MVLLEFWVYEQMTLASGLFGVKEQACQVILINLLNFNYMVASGVQTTTAAVLGNHIGFGDCKKAKEYFRIIIVLGLAIFSIQSLLMYAYMDSILSFATDLDTLEGYADHLKFIYCLNIIPDNMIGLLEGAVKSLALQDEFVMPHVICQGILSSILTYLFAVQLFPDDMIGIWIAKTIVSFSLLFYYGYVIQQTDWEEMTR